jgi:hypothetical protein
MEAKPHLPMPLTGARRIEGERLVYREAQRLHYAKHPDYSRGWHRPSDTTVARALKLIGSDLKVAHLSATDQQALFVALCAAIQAGEDGRILSHNLIFDALAAEWSDWYRAAIEHGPARVSWEMCEATLKAAWRDLGRNEIDMAKMLHLAQDGCGLYKTKRGRDGRYTVELTGATEGLRKQFLGILKEDAAHGGTYQRRGSWPRLRRVDERGETTTDTTTTKKVVAEFAYNIAVPGERSLAVIRHLEGARLYVTAERIESEYDWLMNQAEDVFLKAHELGIDVTQSATKVRIRVKDAGTGETRAGATSAWKRHLGDVLSRKPKLEQAELKQKAISLAKEYDRYIGQAHQLRGPMLQLLDLVRAGKLGRDEEVAIRTRYAKLSNRRFQARDFWFSEVSGKAATETAEPIDLQHYEDDDGNEIEVETDRVASRRGRLFRVPASRPADEREWIAKHWSDPDYAGMPTDDIQDLVGVDVSGSQIQIYAVLLGLQKLEAALRKNRAKAIFAGRAWAKHKDPRDPFELPDNYTGPQDERLQSAMKQAVMEAMYDAKPGLIAERLEDEGLGLGTAANLSRFLEDRELGLDVIATRWKPAMRKIAARAHHTDAFAGITFTDPFDGTAMRWNPIKWEVPQDRRIAGTDDVRISAKVPTSADKNNAGALRVSKEKLASMVGPSFIHTLDSMFCGYVVEELAELGVRDVVAVHDAWYVAADAAGKLRPAIKAASVKWFERLDAVYDELERLLGICTPPTRGKNKGRCCSHCGNWIKELRAAWQTRINAQKYPNFDVGDASPVREIVHP